MPNEPTTEASNPPSQVTPCGSYPATVCSADDITVLWSKRSAGDNPAKNERQERILDLWDAWLEEGGSNYEVECFVVPEMLNKLWALASSQNTPLEPRPSLGGRSAPSGCCVSESEKP